MAFDAFLKLEGIKGESKDAKHTGEIEVNSFSWGLAHTGTFSGGTGGGTGKAAFQDFSFTSDISSASPILFVSCATGKHLSEATLTLRKAGDKQLDFFIVKFSDVLISSFNQAGAGAGDLPVDQFSLNYAKIEVSYTPQKPDGSADAPVRAGYDLKAVKEV